MILVKQKRNNIIKRIEEWYVDLSEKPGTYLFRKLLQSLNVESYPNGRIGLNLGQTLDAFMFGPYEQISQKRIKESITQIKKKINKIQVDQDKFNKEIEEYAKLVYRFYRAVGFQDYEELRTSYINQLVNFFDLKYSKEKNKSFYQQLLFRLSIDHFHILVFAETYLGSDKAIRFEKSKILRDSIIAEFTKKGLDKPLIAGLIKDMDSMGLFNEWTSPTYGGGISHLIVTDLGSKLINFIQE